MVTSKQIQLETEAKRIAGHTVLLQAAHRQFKKFEGGGLDGVHVVRRLDHCDLASPRKRLSSSTIFTPDRDRVEATFNQLLPGAKRSFGLFPIYGFRGKAGFHYRTLVRELASTNSAYFALLNGGKTFTQTHAATQGSSMPLVNGYIMEGNPLDTRQDVLAGFANLKPNQITAQPNTTIAEIRKFIEVHEMQHARSKQLWATDVAFFDDRQTPTLVQERPAFKKFWQKAAQARMGDDEYRLYLEEDLSDTVAALHHLKAGGSIDLLQCVADARAVGSTRGMRPVYGSYRVLDQIVADEYNVCGRLLGASNEDIENMAAKLVGEYAMGREAFYRNGIIACQQALKRADDSGTLGRYQAEAYLELASTYARRLRADPDIVQKLEQEDAVFAARVDKGGYNLCQEFGPLTEEEHKAEVLATVYNAQEMHPEFASPEGGVHLLKMRERALRVLGNLTIQDLAVQDDLQQYFKAKANQVPEQGQTPPPLGTGLAQSDPRQL